MTFLLQRTASTPETLTNLGTRTLTLIHKDNYRQHLPVCVLQLKELRLAPSSCRISWATNGYRSVNRQQGWKILVSYYFGRFCRVVYKFCEKKNLRVT